MHYVSKFLAKIKTYVLRSYDQTQKLLGLEVYVIGSSYKISTSSCPKQHIKVYCGFSPGITVPSGSFRAGRSNGGPGSARLLLGAGVMGLFGIKF